MIVWIDIKEYRDDGKPFLARGRFRGPNPLERDIAVCLYDAQANAFVIEADAGGHYAVEYLTHFASINLPAGIDHNVC